MGVCLAAPAKLNLHLAVLDRRPDGFHDLVSLFQAVDLADELRLERTGAPGPVSLRGMAEPAPGDNLVVRAIELFRQRTGLREGVAAAVEKRIPIGAGFGGGSSDAAAALRCLQALFGSPLHEGELADCARTLGSDVPFFLAGPAALVQGRGERCRELAARSDFAVVAVTPEVRVPTADAFAWLDADRGGRPRADGLAVDPLTLEQAYLGEEPGRWPFGNSFDDSVMSRLPVIAALRERMLSCGARAASLTGSGSTVIAVFPAAVAAAACARRLAADLPPGCLSGGIRILAPLASLPRVQYYG